MSGVVRAMDSDTLASLSREELVSRVQQAEQVVSMDVYPSCGNAIDTVSCGLLCIFDDVG